MKQVEVVAAIIHDSEGRIFATQRGYGEWKNWWEFPGGKIESGETKEDALKREIWEELEANIVIEEFIQTIEYDYPKFHLIMHCYLCHFDGEKLALKEHKASKWLKPSELDSVEWLPADIVLINNLKTNSAIELFNHQV